MRLRNIATCVAAALVAALLLLPAGAGATGGAGMPDPSASFLNVSSAIYVTKSVVVTGRLNTTRPGQRVDVQARLAQKAWTKVGTATVRSDQTFRLKWKVADRVGHYTLRAQLHGAARLASTADPVTATTTTTTAHRSNVATWFGPEDNGSETACGVPLTTTVLGVAHKSLPCGTQVSFLFHGREVTVPVIDRGPYTKGVTWDLTEGTAAALGFTDTGRGKVGAAILTDEPLADLSDLGTVATPAKSKKR